MTQQSIPRRHVVVATSDTLKPQMAGPAIRAWQVAAALAAEHEVQLVTTSDCTISSDDFVVRTISGDAAVHELERWCDVLFFQGNVLADYPFLHKTEKVIVVDLYDPFHLEQLEQTREHDADTRRVIVNNSTAAANKQCLRGDFFVCASERQRDFWLGHLAALGRLNTVTYDADVTVRSLIDVVPFGVSEQPPARTRPALKGSYPGIGADDKVILWGGGIYNWFDPLTLIKAVAEVARTHSDVRLFFLGMEHPHPHVPEMRMSFAARKLADSLGLTGKYVFFNESWVEYDDRANYLLDADVGVSCHLDHLETSFAFRTRMLDYLWASLPMVATRGDVFADLIDDRGLGLTVDAGDVDGLVAALTRMLDDAAFAKQCRENVVALAPDYGWSRVLTPLLEFCRAPHRAPDLLDTWARRRLAVSAATIYQPATGWRRDVELVIEHYREGGAGKLARKAASRALYTLRLKKPSPPQI